MRQTSPCSTIGDRSCGFRGSRLPFKTREDHASLARRRCVFEFVRPRLFDSILLLRYFTLSASRDVVIIGLLRKLNTDTPFIKKLT